MRRSISPPPQEKCVPPGHRQRIPNKLLENWYSTILGQATDVLLDPRVRHGLTVLTGLLKTTSLPASRSVTYFPSGWIPLLTQTCPWNDIGGVIVAGGDVLTLCIWLLSELLPQRYQIPLPGASESLLPQHALSLCEENGALLEHSPHGWPIPPASKRIYPSPSSISTDVRSSVAIRRGTPKKVV